jgi:hypothetical protein
MVLCTHIDPLAAQPNQREIISKRNGAQAITPAIIATNVRNA